ncbi:hypothetical protein N9L06_01475 [Mariniblastus sp.]|nr:hypothetical protein [Mariniblastus sp.]
MEIQRGSFATGREAAAKELGVHPSKFYRDLKRLESLQMITLTTNSRFTVIAVNKYEQYQSKGGSTEQQPNSKTSQVELQVDAVDGKSNNRKRDFRVEKNGIQGSCVSEREQQENNNRTTEPQKANTIEEQVEEGKERKDRFGEFWKVVHRKEGKGKSKTAFQAAVRSVSKDRAMSPTAASDWLTERMKMFAASPQARDPIKGKLHPATWLTQARYDDDESIWQERRSNGKPAEASIYKDLTGTSPEGIA